MPQTNITIRSLANSLKLSRTTVSDALRGAGRVEPGTVLKVKRAAELAGYRRNPLAAALMAEMRRSHSSAFHGVLAAIDFHELDAIDPRKPFQKEILRGATTRAQELGYRLERFIVGQGYLPVHRLNDILESRGILGIIVLPAWNAPDLSDIQWSKFSGVYTDSVIKFPALHSVCSDHFRSIINALSLLVERGYRRPGICLEELRDNRLQRRHRGAFMSFHQGRDDIETIPPLVVSKFAREPFVSWFKQYKPDVVICYSPEVLEWMESCGAEVPKTHGFICANTVTSSRCCAGFDLQPLVIGARAAEMVIAQLFRNEIGIPELPTLTSIPARWVEGPTLKAGLRKVTYL